jgi:chromosome segregation ATPase
MSTKPPDLGKGSFFYRKSAVEQVLQDRDLMLRYLQQRTRDAEGRVAGLEAQLTAVTNDMARKDKELARLEGELVEATATLGELERGRQHVQGEARALGEWRTRVGSMAGPIARRLVSFHGSLDAVPERVQQAFAPIGEREAALQRRLNAVMEHLRAMPSPPRLSAGPGSA